MERRFGAGMNPMEFWRRWYEASVGAWSGALPAVPGGSRSGAGGSVAPYNPYQQWLETMQDLQASMMGSFGFGDGASGLTSQETWRKLFDASVESWRKSIGLGQEMLGMTPRWFEMLEQARSNFANLESVPKDPLEFTVQWYNATSGPFSEFVNDIIEREEFLEFGSRWLQSYASLYKIFSRQSEDTLRNLQLPVRSDISRVAGLIVALEEKVDRIEESFEDFEDVRGEPATAEGVAALERRLDGVENKLDRLLAALENTPSYGAAVNGGPGGPAAGSAGAPEATDAARRKARELGVDLAGIAGSGPNGRITVEDVRRKGDA